MDINKAQKVLREKALKYLKYPNINSVGIGYKYIGNKKTNEISIQFTVNQKARGPVLESLLTKEVPLHFEMDGEQIATDIVQRSFKPSFQLVSTVTKDIRKTRQNPIKPGISVGHPNISAGSIGGIVYGKNNATPYILSNWHVLNGGHGNVGDDILQPGRFDDPNVSQNRLGSLVNSYLGLEGDCAIASIEDRAFDTNNYDLGITPKQLGTADLDDLVVKSGRTTATTYGIVSRVDVHAEVNYGGNTGFQIVRSIEIKPDSNFPAPNNEISMGGDSGSLWHIRDKQGVPSDIAVGLHFAGESSASPDEYALACYTESVFNKMNIIL
ncbi:MAG: hypothetical protein HEP71_03325 [Roseivirga sp.]|nr:hypothetical protein [Roseivirga sp.]